MEDIYKYEKVGVQIDSRYGKPQEYISMAKAINQMPIQYWHYIKSLSCDSKASMLYELIFTKNTPREITHLLAELFEICILDVDNWHNGIYFAIDGEDTEELPANGDNEHKPAKHTQDYWYNVNVIDSFLLGGK